MERHAGHESVESETYGFSGLSLNLFLFGVQMEEGEAGSDFGNSIECIGFKIGGIVTK
jgi:hypothetical protein